VPNLVRSSSGGVPILARSGESAAFGASFYRRKAGGPIKTFQRRSSILEAAVTNRRKMEGLNDMGSSKRGLSSQDTSRRGPSSQDTSEVEDDATSRENASPRPEELRSWTTSTTAGCNPSGNIYIGRESPKLFGSARDRGIGFSDLMI